MISRARIDHMYRYLQRFQSNYEFMIDAMIISELPPVLMEHIRDIEYDAAYDGLIYINLVDLHTLVDYPTVDKIINVCKSLFQDTANVTVYSEGVHNEDDECSIVIDLNTHKSRKWYYD